MMNYLFIAFQFLNLKTTKKKKTIRPFNLLIGATAVSKNLTLATKNVSNFDRLDVIKIDDWTL